jgi:hypothetical protein
MKYDSQLTELKTQMPGAQNILIALPGTITVDKLASSLSLMLSLKKSGKEVSVVTEGQPLVAHGNLYGVGEVKSQINTNTGDNFIISLEGVVDSAGQIPSLEKLDWYPEGQNLNLVFHAMPGQKFEPINIAHKRQGGGGFNIIFTVGATSLNDLGSIYTQNTQAFSNTYLVNIDNNPQNQNFGKTNVIDPNASSISEIVMQLFPSLGLSADNDIASNIVAGIYDATANLVNAKPDSFIAVGQAMQLGAKLPQSQTQTQTPALQQIPQSPAPQVQTPPQPETAQPQIFSEQPISNPPAQPLPEVSPQVQQPPVFQPQPQDNQGFDLSKVLQIPPVPGSNQNESFISPQVADQKTPPNSSDSYEERPTGEFTASHSAESEAKPAPDWLTPKIFKGGSLG